MAYRRAFSMMKPHRRQRNDQAPPTAAQRTRNLRGSRDRVGTQRESAANQGPPDRGLIRFDRKTLVFLGSLFLILALATAFKVHGSSVGVWHRLLDTQYRSPDDGVLFGTPKDIRMDEWNIFTLAIVSQAMVRPSFPVINPGWGPAQVPLIFKFPVRHWSMFVRPQFWGFFVLDLERAFAFYWNVQGVFAVGGVFLLLMLLTENHFGVSVLGSAWMFFSGFIQWWYSNQLLPVLIGCAALVIVAAHYLALSPRRSAIGVSAVVLFACSLNFALGLYPPYQVPLVYLGIAVVAGSIGPRIRAGLGRSHLAFRAGCGGLALVGIAVLLVVFYREARPAIELMRATIYPGLRLVTGGDRTLARLFGGVFGFFMTERRIPQGWISVCEASNFVLLFPIPVAALIWRAWRRRSVTAVEWSLIVYLLAFVSWITVGWPRWLATASAVGLAQPIRAVLGLGLGSILLCCVFLAKSGADIPSSLGRRLVLAAVLGALFLVYALSFNWETEGFATSNEIGLVVLAGAAAAYFLLARGRLAFAACLLVPHVWSYALVNPVAVGLGPVLESPAFQQVSRLVAQDPDARWVAYTNIAVADLLKAAGARVFSGMNIIPPMEDLRAIDPQGAGLSTYNRYGYMVLLPRQGPDVEFTYVSRDLYTMAIDPKGDIWHRLGIRYVVLPSASTDPEFIAKTTLVEPPPGVWIYKYRE